MWYAPGRYDVKVVQFLCMEGERYAGVDVETAMRRRMRPGKARREWERKVRFIEDGKARCRRFM